MGVNYFWRIDVCPACGRAADEYHVGMRSDTGWAFCFQALKGAGGDVPKGFDVIDTAQAWRIVFLETNGQLLDEDGNAVPMYHFWQLVNESMGGKIDHAELGGTPDWRDAEGYRFSWQTFS